MPKERLVDKAAYVLKRLLEDEDTLLANVSWWVAEGTWHLKETCKPGLVELKASWYDGFTAHLCSRCVTSAAGFKALGVPEKDVARYHDSMSLLACEPDEVPVGGGPLAVPEYELATKFVAARTNLCRGAYKTSPNDWPEIAHWDNWLRTTGLENFIKASVVLDRLGGFTNIQSCGIAKSKVEGLDARLYGAVHYTRRLGTLFGHAVQEVFYPGMGLKLPTAEFEAISQLPIIPEGDALTLTGNPVVGLKRYWRGMVEAQEEAFLESLQNELQKAPGDVPWTLVALDTRSTSRMSGGFSGLVFPYADKVEIIEEHRRRGQVREKASSVRLIGLPRPVANCFHRGAGNASWQNQRNPAVVSTYDTERCVIERAVLLAPEMKFSSVNELVELAEMVG